MDYIKRDKNNTTSDIKNLNLFFIIISLIVLSISFIVIIPGFRYIKTIIYFLNFKTYFLNIFLETLSFCKKEYVC